MLDRANKISAELVRIRRDLHAHPEMGFNETRTAALVADTLREIGVDVREGVGRTGVVGTIGKGNGRVIGIRGDMDALPIIEETDKPYISTNPGVMHACGHDAHTAMLLGVAHLLMQSYRQNPWDGEIRLLFQPSEESSDKDGISGAMAMIADDALTDADAVIALHVDSKHPAGLCRFADGYSMSAVDEFKIWVYGTGSHGAYPYTGTDPIQMIAHVLNALYAIPSRRVDPLEPCVVSVGHIKGGATSNVIPAEVYLHGTLRSFSQEIRQQLWDEVERAAKVCEAFGGTYKVAIKKGYPATLNAPEINKVMREVTADLLGKEVIQVEKAFGMGAEDFSYMTQIAPGSMFMLGAAIDDGIVRNHHTPIFDIDESVLPKGSAILAESALRLVRGG
ncbi:MAG TPA: amidohydrolase [Anaerolineae bacterium]|nr:amidohydrolase [Anaerolineae bacterium]